MGVIENCRDAGNLVVSILSRNDDRDDLAAKYRDDPEFNAVVNAFCDGLTLAEPFFYSGKLSVRASGPDSVFAFKLEDLRSNMKAEERAILLVAFWACFQAFWPENGTRGDYVESEWTADVGEVARILREMSSEGGESVAGRETVKDIIYKKPLKSDNPKSRSSFATLEGIAGLALLYLCSWGLAKKSQNNDEGKERYNPTWRLSAQLVGFDWEEFEIMVQNCLITETRNCQ